MIKTIFYPNKPSGNKYLSIVLDIIKSNGYEIYDLDDIICHRMQIKEIKIANLNWFDSITNHSLVKTMIRILKRILLVMYLKVNGVKIIYTLHNKLPHDSIHPFFNRLLMGFMCKTADRIVVLCSYSKLVLRDFISEKVIQKKISYLNLPSYSEFYHQIKQSELDYQYNNKTLRLLFFGLIRPYKNVELILDAAIVCSKMDIEFIIAGKPNTLEYKQYLEERSKELPKVTTIFQFIADEDIPELFSNIDALILPLSLKSSLNSSSAIMAFSMKKTVISPLNGTLIDFPKEDIFTYEYENENEHLGMLLSCINQAYALWKNDDQALKKKGESLYTYLEANYSLEHTKRRYAQLYQELCAKK